MEQNAVIPQQSPLSNAMEEERRRKAEEERMERQRMQQQLEEQKKRLRAESEAEKRKMEALKAQEEAKLAEERRKIEEAANALKREEEKLKQQALEMEREKVRIEEEREKMRIEEERKNKRIEEEQESLRKLRREISEERLRRMESQETIGTVGSITSMDDAVSASYEYREDANGTTVGDAGHSTQHQDEGVPPLEMSQPLRTQKSLTITNLLKATLELDEEHLHSDDDIGSVSDDGSFYSAYSVDSCQSPKSTTSKLEVNSVPTPSGKKSKKKKKKKRKKKKRRSAKTPSSVMMNPVITEQNSANMWDVYEMAYEEHAKEKQRKKSKRKKVEKTEQYTKYRNEASSSSEVEYYDEETQYSEPKVKRKKKVKERTLIKRSSTSRLMEDRKSAKEAKNQTRGGFKIRPNHRYRLDDGRIGICKFRGRTLFGKSSEDWVGLLVEHGVGVHNGTVKGKTYFRCTAGKGIMVRPQRVIEDLGLSDGSALSKKMIRGSKSIRALLRDIAYEKEEEYQRKLAEKNLKRARHRKDDNDLYTEWKPPIFDDYEEDHSEAFQPRNMYPKTRFSQDGKTQKKLTMYE